jgi:hypothetical protein
MVHIGINLHVGNVLVKLAKINAFFEPAVFW